MNWRINGAKYAVELALKVAKRGSHRWVHQFIDEVGETPADVDRYFVEPLIEHVANDRTQRIPQPCVSVRHAQACRDRHLTN